MGHWKDYHLELLNDAKNYGELLYITFDMLNRIPKPIAMVCGPITSGKKNKEENLKIFGKTISKLSKKYSIFDQVVLEPHVQKIRRQHSCSSKKSNNILLESFYGPILESRLIEKTFFINGWEFSHGATWEHEKAKKIGIEIFYLPENFLKKH